MGTPFVEIYDIFMKSISSEKFAKFFTIDQLEDTLEDYLFHSADIEFIKCKKDLTKRDENGFEEELTGQEKRILAMGMKVKWFESNFVANEKLLHSRLTTKDYMLYSPANQINTLRELLYDIKQNMRKEILKYQYNMFIKE